MNKEFKLELQPDIYESLQAMYKEEKEKDPENGRTFEEFLTDCLEASVHQAESDPALMEKLRRMAAEPEC